jgi:hypothetical protein
MSQKEVWRNCAEVLASLAKYTHSKEE